MTSTPTTKPDRLDSLDCLRGMVIVLMALDHTRDFFGAFTWGGPENAFLTPPSLFFTRWITHFCAPTFVLLAGMGAYLAQTRGMRRKQLFAFLVTRGCWLILLEVTVVHFGWSFDWNFRQGMLQVIWAIGAGMIGLAFLIWLPPWCLGLLGALIIAGHNSLDAWTGEKLVTQFPGLAWCLGNRGWFWDLLHAPYQVFRPGEGFQYFNLYPLLPWFGVLCLGYGLGPILGWPAVARRRTLLLLGLFAIAGFILLRYFNLYGDPSHWRMIPGGDQPMNVPRTTMSFLACTKYPPSLLFLLMTLGPALIFLMLLEWRCPWVKRFFMTYGRVPLFFYILHLPLIHGLALLAAKWQNASSNMSMGLSPLSKGYPLPDVYLAWAVVVLLLYFPCLGYGLLKKRYGGILKYL